MNTRTRLLIALAATAAGALTTTPAGATDAPTCVVTAQPWDLRSYHLAYTDHNGGMHTLISRQDGSRLEPTDYEIPADFDTVLWATKRGVIDGPNSFYDHLHNGGGCTFDTPYGGIPGKRDSVVIRVGYLPPATVPTSAAPTTSTTTAPTTSTTVEPPATSASTTPETPTTVTRVDPQPPQPGIDTPSTAPVTDVALTPDPTPYTAVPQLPVTGGYAAIKALWGASIIGFGLLLLALRKHVVNRTNTTRRMDSE